MTVRVPVTDPSRWFDELAILAPNISKVTWASSYRFYRCYKGVWYMDMYVQVRLHLHNRIFAKGCAGKHNHSPYENSKSVRQGSVQCSQINEVLTVNILCRVENQGQNRLVILLPLNPLSQKTYATEIRRSRSGKKKMFSMVIVSFWGFGPLTSGFLHPNYTLHRGTVRPITGRPPVKKHQVKTSLTRTLGTHWTRFD